MERVLGEVDHGRPGPTFLAQGGIHGNEPAGVDALRRVMRTLVERDIPVHGRVVACSGNLLALSRRQRFVDPLQHLGQDHRRPHRQIGTQPREIEREVR